MEHLSSHDSNPNNASGRAGQAPHSGAPPHHPQGGRFQQPSPPAGSPHPQQPQTGAPPQQPGAMPVLPQQGPPQLPPQLFTTAAQLLDLTDKKLVLILRDGRKLIGVLRSWDQFANLVLQNTVERIYAGKLFGDMPCGVYLVRGENVLLLGEIDLDKDDDIPEGYRQASYKEVAELKKKEDAERKQSDKRRGGKLQTLGFEAEHSGEILF